MKKQYIAPQILSMAIQPVVMQSNSKTVYSNLKGHKGYGGKATGDMEADSRFFDDWDDEEDDF